MTLALDATPVGTSANAYLDRTAADAIFEGMLGATAWFALTNAEKDQALVAATAIMEREKYRGTIIQIGQALSWPRYSLWDNDGRPLPVDVVPSVVKRATCEQVLFMLTAAAAQSTANSTATSALTGFKLLTVGPITIEPAAGGADAVAIAAASAEQLAPAVGRLLAQYLWYGAPGTIRLRREDD